ncbi:hypothetical protein [Kribbella sp. NPDC051770]|uniref:hypothetical protein n=1 Tax=Kribbella sp. NPDC051770 TaxID=3155413 RepID=UPI0034342E13
MSDSAYHLVSYGVDRAGAVEAVERLLRLNATPERVLVELECETTSHALDWWLSAATVGWTTMEFLLPAALAVEVEWLLVADGRPRSGVVGPEGVHLWVEPTDTAALDKLADEAPVPVRVYVGDLPAAEFSWDLIPPEPARTLVHWDDCRWPAGAADSGESKHAGVAVAFNASTLWELDPGSTGYRVYVETRSGDVDLARRLAAAVDLSVVGEPEYL